MLFLLINSLEESLDSHLLNLKKIFKKKYIYMLDVFKMKRIYSIILVTYFKPIFDNNSFN